MDCVVDQQQNDTNAALQRIQTLLPSLDVSPLPAVVHHYTDTPGVLGILESGELWATDYRYLNDSSELQYTFDLARSVAESELQRGGHDAFARGFLEYAVTGTPPYSDTAYRLCCFSAVDNSLSQWRAYGGRQGFSLAFPGDISHQRGLEEVAARQGQTPGITLLKVNYGLEQQREYITRLVRELVTLFQTELARSYPAAEQAVTATSPFYWGQLERASYRFKHPDFADEQEWRLVVWGRQAESFRASATLTPYTKFQLFSAIHPNIYSAALPLVAVRHGPAASPAQTRVGLDRLLSTRGYPAQYCERRGSDTPVRL